MRITRRDTRESRTVGAVTVLSQSCIAAVNTIVKVGEQHSHSHKRRPPTHPSTQSLTPRDPRPQSIQVTAGVGSIAPPPPFSSRTPTTPTPPHPTTGTTMRRRREDSVGPSPSSQAQHHPARTATSSTSSNAADQDDDDHIPGLLAFLTQTGVSWCLRWCVHGSRGRGAATKFPPKPQTLHRSINLHTHP